MADRAYTTKTRAKRIALEYFKRPHPFRRAKFLLSVTLPAVAILVLAGFFVLGDHRLYNSGPVSMAHAMFGARCTECHTAASGPAPAGVTPRATFFLPVSNETCSVCHEGPKHHENEKLTPKCESCHFEHKGRGRLVDFGDRQCTRCHENLVAKQDAKLDKDAKPRFEVQVTSFQSRHPQFLATLTSPNTADPKNKTEQRVSLDAQDLTDPTQMCLNHKEHFKPGAIARDEKSGMPKCAACHEPDAQRAYIAPVKYAKHCAECHPLKFDDGKFPGETAPHDTPEVVRAFLRKRYSEARTEAKAPADKPAEEEGGGRGRRVGRRGDDKEEAPKGFSTFKEAETALFFRNKSKRDTCLYCHSLAVPGTPTTIARCGETEEKQTEAIKNVSAGLKDGDRLPEVIATNMPTRWHPNSRFTHRAHRPLACASCHDRALASTATGDVLVPKIATCRECHRDAGGARSACVECHVYHNDKNRKRDLAGPLTLKGFAHGEQPPPAKGAK
jgi:hypothetical protein